MSNQCYFKCQGLGHIVSDCPKRRIIILAEWDAIREEDNEEQHKENEEEELGEEQEDVDEDADDDEGLGVRRVLSNQRGVKDE